MADSQVCGGRVELSVFSSEDGQLVKCLSCEGSGHAGQDAAEVVVHAGPVLTFLRLLPRVADKGQLLQSLRLQAAALTAILDLLQVRTDNLMKP